ERRKTRRDGSECMAWRVPALRCKQVSNLANNYGRINLCSVIKPCHIVFGEMNAIASTSVGESRAAGIGMRKLRARAKGSAPPAIVDQVATAMELQSIMHLAETRMASLWDRGSST